MFDCLGTYMELTSSWPRKSSTPILQRHVAPSGINILLQYESFSTKMQTKHISNIYKNYLKTIEDEGVLTVVDFPPQSPDLNPRWGWRPEKAKYSAISQEALQGTVKSCCDKLGHQVLYKPVSSSAVTCREWDMANIHINVYASLTLKIGCPNTSWCLTPSASHFPVSTSLGWQRILPLAMRPRLL